MAPVSEEELKGDPKRCPGATSTRAQIPDEPLKLAALLLSLEAASEPLSDHSSAVPALGAFTFYLSMSFSGLGWKTGGG